MRVELLFWREISQVGFMRLLCALSPIKHVSEEKGSLVFRILSMANTLSAPTADTPNRWAKG